MKRGSVKDMVLCGSWMRKREVSATRSWMGVVASEEKPLPSNQHSHQNGERRTRSLYRLSTFSLTPTPSLLRPPQMMMPTEPPLAPSEAPQQPTYLYSSYYPWPPSTPPMYLVPSQPYSYLTYEAYEGYTQPVVSELSHIDKIMFEHYSFFSGPSSSTPAVNQPASRHTPDICGGLGRLVDLSSPFLLVQPSISPSLSPLLSFPVLTVFLFSLISSLSLSHADPNPPLDISALNADLFQLEKVSLATEFLLLLCLSCCHV